jgi:RNA polymerase sigma-70 factor (ECF subfamily)
MMGAMSDGFRDMAVGELDAVYRMAMHLSRNPEEAGDLVQETYLRAFKSQHTFELREAGIRPWLFKILHNVFFTARGKQARGPMLAEDLSNQPSDANDDAAPAWDLESLDWEQVDDRLKHAIAELPQPFRQVLLLWAVEGLKYREVADVLDIPLGTVMSRLYRARALLSAGLKDLAAEWGIRPAPTREPESESEKSARKSAATG